MRQIARQTWRAGLDGVVFVVIVVVVVVTVGVDVVGNEDEGGGCGREERDGRESDAEGEDSEWLRAGSFISD